MPEPTQCSCGLPLHDGTVRQYEHGWCLGGLSYEDAYDQFAEMFRPKAPTPARTYTRKRAEETMWAVMGAVRGGINAASEAAVETIIEHALNRIAADQRERCVQIAVAKAEQHRKAAAAYRVQGDLDLEAVHHEAQWAAEEIADAIQKGEADHAE